VGGAGVNEFQFVNGNAGGNDLIQNWNAHDYLELTGYTAPATVSIVSGATQMTLSDGTHITIAGLTTPIPTSHIV